jgi:hypothetical protein
LAPRKRKATASSCAVLSAPNPTDRQKKISTMLSLADECGFACTALTEFKQLKGALRPMESELATARALLVAEERAAKLANSQASN